jgi:hypothetical protein
VRGQPLEHVGQVRQWVKTVESRRVHQRHDCRSALATAQAASEQPIRPSDRQFQFILPMSGRKLRSSTVGMRFMADGYAACIASAALPARLSTWRSVTVSSLRSRLGCLMLPSAPR